MYLFIYLSIYLFIALHSNFNLYFLLHFIQLKTECSGVKSMIFSSKMEWGKVTKLNLISDCINTNININININVNTDISKIQVGLSQNKT